jgi:uncharacterized membrane protein
MSNPVAGFGRIKDGKDKIMDYLVFVIAIILAVMAILLVICIVILFALLKTIFDGAIESTETNDAYSE